MNNITGFLNSEFEQPLSVYVFFSVVLLVAGVIIEALNKI